MSATAEISVLGAIVLSNTSYAEAVKLGLKANDFSLDSHRRIFSRMTDLVESSRPIDLVTLIEELERHGELDSVGGAPYISGLLDGVPDRPSIEHYVRIVRQAAERQRAAKQIEAAQRAVSDPSVPASAIAEIGSSLAQICEGELIPPRFSEDALALRFSHKYAPDLRYVHRWGVWMRWDGMRWAEDTTCRGLRNTNDLRLRRAIGTSGKIISNRFVSKSG